MANSAKAASGAWRMGLSLLDLVRLEFRAPRAADEMNARFQTLLGLPHRYGPARLALGRSLGVAAQPTIDLNHKGYGKAIKGEHLFGTGVELAAWTSLIVEHAGRGDVDRKEFQALVSAHWQRGLNLLWDDWKTAGYDFDAFVRRLAGHSDRLRSRSAASARA